MTDPLQRYKILIADPDAQLALVLKAMLNKMGFGDIRLAKNSEETYDILQSAHHDILIADGTKKNEGGLDLVRQIRRNPRTIRPAIPIVFISGRAEASDVIAARDAGINEYVKKPFSAKTVFMRLERIVDYPRSFIAVQGFIGPDRRSRADNSVAKIERRRAQPTAQRPASRMSFNPKPKDPPLLFSPDYTLKEKLGYDTKLSTLITPAKLNLAQVAIEAFALESLSWIRNDLRQMWIYFHALRAEEYTPFTSGAFLERLLSIRARTATFGYATAAQIADLLYNFSSSQMNPANNAFQTIVRKHLEVLQVILANHLRGEETLHATLIVEELNKLVKKYAPPVAEKFFPLMEDVI